jgi:hypothetical protein
LPVQLGKHFFLPFSFLSGVRIDYLAPTLYVTDVIVVSLIIINLKLFKKTISDVRLLIFLILFAVNIIFSLSPFISIYSFIKCIELYAMFVILRHTKLSAKAVLTVLLVSTGIQLCLSLAQFIEKHTLQGIFYYLGERALNLSTPDIAKGSWNGVEFLRPYGTFSHPNSMAGFYLALYFGVITLPVLKDYQWKKNGLLLMCAMLILLSFSKTAIISFALINAFYLLQKGVIDCQMCKYGRITILTVLAFVFTRIHGDPYTIDKRITLMQNALSIFLQHPVTGTGMGAYLVSQNEFPIKQSYFFLQPVHNVVLLFITQAGLLLGGYTLYLLYTFFRSVRYPAFYYLTFAAILITGMVDHYWLTLQQNWLLLPVITALPFTLLKTHEKNN